MVKILSKTNFLLGYQCPKKLWLSMNRQDIDIPINSNAIFNGHQVGATAHRLFDGCVLVGALSNEEKVKQTIRFLE